MRLPSPKLVALLLGLGVLADARAATLTLDRDVVPAGGTIVFSITTELAGWPDDPEGAEEPRALAFITNDIGTPVCWAEADLPSYDVGSDFEVPFPGPLWNTGIGVCDALTPGTYYVGFNYLRYNNSPPATGLIIERYFTVAAAPVELEVTPRRIPVDGTVSFSADVNLGQPAILSVICPDLGFTLSGEFDVDQTVSWPSAFFDDPHCDSSLPGEYTATLSAGFDSFDTESFWVYGDRDGDGLFDPDDNCPSDPNPGQEDADGDDQGDVCDPDDDGDGVNGGTDNCPALVNPSQADLDEDGEGDACDPDVDGDGIANESDNCPNVANPEQQEACVADPNDTDGDGATNLDDNCPDAFNPGQQDPDGDGIGSACDLDIDGDGLGNDDEAAAGTNPLGADALDENGITTLWAGTVINSTDVVEDGEIVGVVVDADPDVQNASIRVIDPVGGPYLLRDFLGSTPFAFAFVPILPGDWTIEAELGNGALLTAVVHVIPEPVAALGALAAVATLLVLRRR